MTSRLTCLVTAGGTSEPIDDVRAITNFSTGRFGHLLARELYLQAPRGSSVTELCPRSTLDRLGVEAGVSYEHFTDAASLKKLLLEREFPAVVFHAAAVADYSPVRTEGKISSDQEELTLTLRRNPKLIAAMREVYGRGSFICGFKLLSGASEEELVAAAQKQLHGNRLNMVVANDLQQISEESHPILVCTAEGGVLRFSGPRARVARELVAFVLRRAQTHWFRSVSTELEDSADHSTFDETLSAVHSMNLLYDASGNVSARVPGGLLVSPRGVDKSELTPANAIYTQVDLAASLVQFLGERKPSIDSGMSAMLYDALPKLESIMHFHSGWGRMATETRFPYPCGAREETEEILAVQGANAALAVELIHHGFLVGLEAGDRERILSEWEAATHEYGEHLSEVAATRYLNRELLRPVWRGKSVVGVILADPKGASVYLCKSSRGGGVGSKVVEQLIQRRYLVRTVDDCGVRDYYRGHGFTEEWDSLSETWVLTPPGGQP